MKNIIFISAVSGVGKSTTCEYIKRNNLLEEYEIFDIDELENINNYTESTYNLFYENAIQKAIIKSKNKNIILCSCINPRDFENLNIHKESYDIKNILITCSDEELEKRLKARDKSRNCGTDDYIKGQIDYQKFILNNLKSYKLHLNNTNKSIDEIVNQIVDFISNYKNINNDLIQYIEKVINEHYTLNDKGHDKQHAEYVINRSLKFANQLENINIDMVYVIAAYHDVAHHIDEKRHEELSAKLLLEDKKLKDFFNEDEIKIMSEAVADHRSSLEGEPRTIYGKIVSSADRNTSVEVTLKRCYSYNKKHSPELSEEAVIEKCRLFLLEKFGVNGYARNKMYFNDEEYDKYLDDITNLASDNNKFVQEIKRINEI